MRTSKTGAATRVAPPPTALPPPQPHELLQGPSRDELIRRHAYELYERNGRVDGHALDDWLTAETELSHLVVDATAPFEPAVERE